MRNAATAILVPDNQGLRKRWGSLAMLADRFGSNDEGKPADAQEVSSFSGEPGWDRTSDPVIKSHVLYRLSYGLERVDNAPSYVGFAGFAQVASDRDHGSSIPLIEHGEGGCSQPAAPPFRQA